MPNAASSRLVATDVSVELGGRTVVDGVSVDLRPGRVLAIIGPNGAGKTSLLKALLGLLPSTGAIAIDGVAQGELDRLERARRVAYVPQRSGLNAAMPVEDVVAMARFASGYGQRGDDPSVTRALERVDAVQLRHRPFTELSGGEQRLVLVARALCSEAPTILLDEPTSSLDVAHRLALCLLLRSLADEGLAIACVLHDLDDARRFADDVLVLDRGRAVASSVTPDMIRDVYGVDARERDALGFHPLPSTVRSEP